jgi:hypothetical protein
MQSTEQAQRRGFMRVIAGFGAAAVLVALVLFFSKVRICDEQLSNQGSLVPVCRHLQLSDPPVTVAGIVLLGLIVIAFPVAEISVFGFSLKQRIDEATAVAQAAKEAAKASEEAAERANETSRLADQVSRTAQQAAEDAAKTAKAASDAAHSAEQSTQVLEEIQRRARDRLEGRERRVITDVLASLINEYNDVRTKDPQTSPARTAKLNSIIAKMIAETSESGPNAIDVGAALATRDLGTRVAAYAYFYANPDPDKLQLLVDAVVNEPEGHRFGQYWGLRAIRRQVLARPDALDENSRNQLEGLLRSIGQGTDRAYEIREILKNAPGKNA